MTELVHIPFRGGEVLAVEIEGRPHVVLRPALESIGLDYSTQLAKLRSRSWASVGLCPTQVPGDNQRREVVVVDVRTFLMLLATIDERRVAIEIRPTLVAYQNEVADAIERHFTKARGGVDEYVPFTWTLDEVCAIIRQRYLHHYHVQTLTAAFRTAGIWKQNGTPTAPFAWCFHFTGTAWTVHPYAIPKLAARLMKVEQQLRESYGIQLRLQMEGVGEVPAISP